MDLQRKAGPLPLWAWIAMAAAVGAVVYIRARAKGGTATPADPAAPVDPSANDQLGTTGLVSNLPLSYFIQPAPQPAPVVAEGYHLPGLPAGWPGPAGAPDPNTAPVENLLGGPGRPPLASGFTNTPATGIYARAAQMLTGAADAPPAAPVAASVPGVPADQRQPAHPHEQVHAPAPTHHASPPASTRFNAPSSRTRAPHSPDSPHAPGAIPYPVGRPSA